MTENEIATVVVDACVHIHRVLGPGMLESVYERVLAHELQKRGLRVRRQVPIAVEYEGVRLGGAFKADLLVEGKVLLELKSLPETARVHRKQTLTYVRLAGLKLGILLNFGAPRMKDGITRLALGL